MKSSLALWQEQTLEQLRDFLLAFHPIQAVYVVGSLADPEIQIDYWSDIDLLCVISDQSVQRFYDDTAWLDKFRPIFTFSRSEQLPRRTLRICFTDLRRIDFILLPASEFTSKQAQTDHYLNGSCREIFSRGPAYSLSHPDVEQTSPSVNHNLKEELPPLVNDFWFKGMLAVTKVARDDLLIALHLSLDLIRDCLLLKMILRDQSEDTRHHRFGGVGNTFLTELNTLPLEFSAAGILDIIESCCISFERLIQDLSPGDQAQHQPLVDYINLARQGLKHKSKPD